MRPATSTGRRRATASWSTATRAQELSLSWTPPALTPCCTPSRTVPMGAHPREPWFAIRPAISTEPPIPAEHQSHRSGAAAVAAWSTSWLPPARRRCSSASAEPTAPAPKQASSGTRRATCTEPARTAGYRVGECFTRSHLSSGTGARPHSTWAEPRAEGTMPSSEKGRPGWGGGRDWLGLKGVPGLGIRDGKGEVVPCHDRAPIRSGEWRGAREGKGAEVAERRQKGAEVLLGLVIVVHVYGRV